MVWGGSKQGGGRNEWKIEGITLKASNVALRCRGYINQKASEPRNLGGRSLNNNCVGWGELREGKG